MTHALIPVEKENLHWVADDGNKFTCHWERSGKKFSLTFGAVKPKNMLEFVAALNEAETQPEELMQEAERTFGHQDYSKCCGSDKLKLPAQICTDK